MTVQKDISKGVVLIESFKESKLENYMEVKRKVPGRLWYGVSVIILIAGIIVYVLWLINGITGITRGFQQIIVPGKSDILLSKPGKYTIFYEFRSRVNGRIYLTKENLSGLECTIKEKSSGQNINLESPKITSSYSVGSRSGTSILEFTIAKAGIFELTTENSKDMEQEFVIAIGKNIVGNILYVILVGIAGLLFTVAISVALFVIVFLKRRKYIANNKVK